MNLTPEQQAELDRQLNKAKTLSEISLKKELKDIEKNYKLSLETQNYFDNERKRLDKLVAENQDFVNAIPEKHRHMARKFLEYAPKDLNEVRNWQILGEDPNPDWGGSHIEPTLALVEGTYTQACAYAVTVPGFFQWGAGGKVVPSNKIKAIKL